MSPSRHRRLLTSLPIALQQFTGRTDLPGYIKLRELAINGRLGSSVAQASNGRWEWEAGTEAQIAAALGMAPASAALASAA